ncbi:MAG TPA: 3'-5' exonuclease [Candidatus Thermoplasmatota archaeon]|nr:3'-5' exonuclease [Candidatus Thermoplasmatota archaeon]
MRILALDTETCALRAGRDRIVQFCAVELDAELEEQGRWVQFVDPGIPIPPHATAIHGITDDDVRGRPRFAAVAPRLRRLLEGAVLMAYNARFDAGVLDLEFRRCGIPPLPADMPVIDPLVVERQVNSRSLGPTYERYTGLPLLGAHDAEADTVAMVEVLRRQRRVHASRLPARVQDLVLPLGGIRRVPRPRTRTQRTLDVATSLA